MERENLAGDAKGKGASGSNREAESTDAPERGGLPCTRLLLEWRIRDLALFNLAIDSKLRGCDVVAVKVEDVAPNGYTMDRATVRQKKTGRPVKLD